MSKKEQTENYFVKVRGVNGLQEEMEKKYKKREKKKKRAMKISGAGVKGLQRIKVQKAGK